MKDVILLELARKWENDAVETDVRDGSPEAERGNLLDRGNREGKRECADTLRMIVGLIGDSV